MLPARRLGRTDLELPILSFGASSLGQEFLSVALDEALASVRAALECGLSFIDTSPFYVRGMSEVLLGIALRGVPRESDLLGTKLGRYDLGHFDFSARRVAESIDVSLHRLGCGHLDIVLCHDIEFVPLGQIVEETLPALRRMQRAGKVRWIGFSGYPRKIFRAICDRAEVDCVLSYNQYTLAREQLTTRDTRPSASPRPHTRLP
jgi:aryl-alcohol dehydrogenase-like predicted oxidoreductase